MHWSRLSGVALVFVFLITLVIGCRGHDSTPIPAPEPTPAPPLTTSPTPAQTPSVAPTPIPPLSTGSTPAQTPTVTPTPTPPTVESTPGAAILNIEPIRQSTTIKNLCGPTCAEMMLRFYGISDKDQYVIGKSIAEMIPEYKRQHPDAADAKEFQWPNYEETYQPILAQYLKELGFQTVTTKAQYEAKTGEVPVERFENLMDFVRKGVPAIVHVERHYLLVVGCDDNESVLYINDPADGQRKTVSYSSFRNRTNPWYQGRSGWDGRFLAIWK